MISLKDSLIITACLLLIEGWVDWIVFEYRSYKRLPAYIEVLRVWWKRSFSFKRYMGL